LLNHEINSLLRALPKRGYLEVPARGEIVGSQIIPYFRRFMIAGSMNARRNNILIVAGEASADRYGARLVEKLRSIHGNDALHFFGTGGDEMGKAGVELLCHIRDLAHIGPRDALANIAKYYGIFRKLIHASSVRPTCLAILLDFPDFNLRLAKKMKRAGIKVVYYISPQLWAWRRGRIKTVSKYVDRMLVILPFEEDYYQKRGVQVEFVGHPLLEDFSPNYDRSAMLLGLGLDPARKTIALLSGSRRKEVERILPILLNASLEILSRIQAQFLISAAPTVDLDHIRRITANMLERNPNAAHFRVVTADSRDILAASDFAFVKSGTSTLEAALVGTPFVITYKISFLSWLLGRILVRSPHLGLVNLIAGEEIVPELFQWMANPRTLSRVALEYLEQSQKAATMRSHLAQIRGMLGARHASESVAAAVSSYL
jgi:lipid-A-disaccharide synthase